MNRIKLLFWRLSIWDIFIVSIALGVATNKDADYWLNKLIRGVGIKEAANVFKNNRSLRYTVAALSYLATVKTMAYVMAIVEKTTKPRLVELIKKLKKDAEIEGEPKSVIDCVKMRFKTLEPELIAEIVLESFGALFGQSSLYKASKLNYAKEYVIASSAIDFSIIFYHGLLDDAVIKKLETLPNIDKKLLNDIAKHMKEFKIPDINDIELNKAYKAIFGQARNTSSSTEENENSGLIASIWNTVIGPVKIAKTKYEEVKKVLKRIKESEGKGLLAKLVVSNVLGKVFARIFQVLLLKHDMVLASLLASIAVRIFGKVLVDPKTIECLSKVAKNMRNQQPKLPQPKQQ